MRKVVHKSFTPKTLETFELKSFEAIAEEVRCEAETFINKLGAENVLSITENTLHETFTVVVWHYGS